MNLLPPQGRELSYQIGTNLSLLDNYMILSGSEYIRFFSSLCMNAKSIFQFFIYEYQGYYHCRDGTRYYNKTK